MMAGTALLVWPSLPLAASGPKQQGPHIVLASLHETPALGGLESRLSSRGVPKWRSWVLDTQVRGLSRGFWTVEVLLHLSLGPQGALLLVAARGAGRAVVGGKAASTMKAIIRAKTVFNSWWSSSVAFSALATRAA